MTHVLVVEDGDWWVEHPPDCPRERVGTRGSFRPPGAPRRIDLAYTCAVAQEVDYDGLGSLDASVEDLESGRYAVEAWAIQSEAGPWGPAGWEGGLSLGERLARD